MNKPVSLLVISWYLIISNTIALISIFIQMVYKFIPLENIFSVLMFLPLLLIILSSVLMLNGWKIGRTLYTGIAIFNFLSAVYSNSENSFVLTTLSVSIVLVTLFIILLYRADVTQYFQEMKVLRSQLKQGSKS